MHKLKLLLGIISLSVLFLYTLMLLSVHLLVEIFLSQSNDLYSFLSLLKRYEILLGFSAIPLFLVGVVTDGLGYRPPYIRIGLIIIGIMWLPMYLLGTLFGIVVILYGISIKSTKQAMVKTK